MAKGFCLRFIFVATMFLAVASSCFVNAVLAQGTKEEAAAALVHSEGTLASAYIAVLEAEELGANVSALLSQLNLAGEFLTRANMAYRSGNFDEVSLLANSSRDIGIEVEYEATKLKNSATSEGLQSMISTMILSVVGMAGIILGSYWVRLFLKKRYNAISNL